jgi:hypothetical protein
MDDVDVNVVFTAVDGAVQIKDGQHFYKADESAGSVKAHFIPRATVTGKIVVAGQTHDAAGHVFEADVGDGRVWYVYLIKRPRTRHRMYKDGILWICITRKTRLLCTRYINTEP